VEKLMTFDSGTGDETGNVLNKAVMTEAEVTATLSADPAVTSTNLPDITVMVSMILADVDVAESADFTAAASANTGT